MLLVGQSRAKAQLLLTLNSNPSFPPLKKKNKGNLPLPDIKENQLYPCILWSQTSTAPWCHKWKRTERCCGDGNGVFQNLGERKDARMEQIEIMLQGKTRKEQTPKSFSNCWILLMSSGLLKEPTECSHPDPWLPETLLLDFSDH